MRPPFPLRAIRSEGVVCIRDSEDARAKWNVRTAQIAGISIAIDAFVMMKQHQGRLFKAVETAQHGPTEFGMSPHVLHFLVGQSSFFEENMVGHADLADV